MKFLRSIHMLMFYTIVYLRMENSSLVINTVTFNGRDIEIEEEEDWDDLFTDEYVLPGLEDLDLSTSVLSSTKTLVSKN